MKRELKITLWLVGALLVALCSVPVYMLYDLCSNDEFSTTLSPSGKYKAVVVARDCGATTSYNFIVDVGEKTDQFCIKKVGWIYGAVRNTKMNYGVSVVWLSDSELIVSYCDAHSLKLENNEPVVGGQRITVSFVQNCDEP